MANPVISNVTVKYVNNRGYKLPGEAAEIFVEAFDADNQTISVTLTVKDSAGNESASQTIELLQTDALTYTATATGATVTQDPAMPNHFYVV